MRVSTAPPRSGLGERCAGCVRVGVRDASPRTPVRPNASASNMTGRGIQLVESLSARWGVSVDERGKVVWAEFGSTGADNALESLVTPEEPPTVESDAPTARERRYRVVLGDVPTDLLIEAKAHMDNLVRELSAGEAISTSPSADPFGALIQTVVHSFGEARDAIKRQAIAARPGAATSGPTCFAPTAVRRAGRRGLPGSARRGRRVLARGAAADVWRHRPTTSCSAAGTSRPS